MLDPKTLYSVQVVKCMIKQARNTFLKMRHFLTTRSFDLTLRYRLIKCYATMGGNRQFCPLLKISPYFLEGRCAKFKISCAKFVQKHDLSDPRIFQTLRRSKIGHVVHYFILTSHIRKKLQISFIFFSVSGQLIRHISSFRLKITMNDLCTTYKRLL